MHYILCYFDGTTYIEIHYSMDTSTFFIVFIILTSVVILMGGNPLLSVIDSWLWTSFLVLQEEVGYWSLFHISRI